MNNNYSELLYLFIDGEATTTEKTTLFSALSQDQDLQDEFYDALNMRTVAFNDASRMTPPAYLGRNILKAAGVSTAISSLTASGLVTGISKALPTLCGVVLGTIFTFGIMKWTDNGLPAVQKNQIAVQPLETDNSTIKQMTSGIPKESPLQTELKTIVKTVYVPVERLINVEELFPMSAMTLSEQPVLQQTQRTEQNVSNTEPVITQAPDFNSIYTNHSIQVPSTVTADIPPDSPTNELREHPFMFQLNGIRDLSIYSADLGIYHNPAFNNISGAIFYKLSDNSSAGISVGQEDLPLFVELTNKQFVPRQSIFWAGGAFRYEFESLGSFADMRPYGQTTVAMTQVGPLTKTSLGFRWIPDSRVSLHIGAEVLGLIFNNENNRYQMVSKLGFTYGLDIVF